MAIKYFCDYCITECYNYYTIIFDSREERAYPTVGLDFEKKYLICHDCYWKIQGFIKSLQILDDNRT